MKNNLTTTNQNAKLALSKSKSLLDLANKLLSKKDSGELAQSFPFKPFIRDKVHSDHIYSVAITPNGKKVVSGSNLKPIKIWDIESGECLKTLEVYSGWINSIAITPNGKKVVLGSRNGTITIWDIESGNKCLQTLEGHTGTTSYSVTVAVAITPNGKKVISGSDDKTIKIWDIESGECLQTLEGHTGTIYSVAITPNGKKVVSGSRDETIKIWDIESGECIYTIDNTAKVSIDKDGYFRGELEDIREYVRVSEAPLTQRELTDEEIEYFRKKGDFLKVCERVSQPTVEEKTIKKDWDLPF